MMTTSEKATQKSITLPTRSVHHTSFLWALCQELVLSTTHRSVAQNGDGLPFLEISASSPRSLRRSRVAFESYPRSRWTFVPSGNPPRVSATLSRVSGSSGESWRLAGAVTVPRGMPFASTAVERLMPRLPLSTGLLPAFSPPQGALVMHPSTATSLPLRGRRGGRRLRALFHVRYPSPRSRSTRRAAREAWLPSTLGRRSCGKRSRTPRLAQASRRPPGRVCGAGDSPADDPPSFLAAAHRTVARWAQ